MGVVPNSIYRRNLAALAPRQPVVAQTLETTEIPDSVTPAEGRDGSATFRLPGADGRIGWFGGTSMPTVSAEALVAGMRAEGASVILPGILTGLEAVLALRNLPAQGALFVAEADALQVKLALHLHDLAEASATGRLIFLLGADLEGALLSFFTEQPGYEYPSRMLVAPQRLAAELAELQRRLESTVAAVDEQRAGRVNRVVDRLRGRTQRPLPAEPRVVLVSVDACPATQAQVARIGRAFSALGWPWTASLPDRPDNWHLCARLEVLAEHDPDLVVLINSPPGALRPLLPAELPLAGWYLPQEQVERGLDPRLGPADSVWAASRAQREALCAAGLPAERVEILAPAADGVLLTPEQEGADESPLTCDIGIVADLPNDTPEASGISLPSQVTLWNALREAVARRPDRYSSARAEDFLVEAERTSGVQLRDEEVRAAILQRARLCVGPARVTRAAVEALRRPGQRVDVWGANWEPFARDEVVLRGPTPAGEELRDLLRGVRVLVLPRVSVEAVQVGLDALAAGVPVVCQIPEGGFENAYPGLEELVPFMYLYERSGQIAGTVERVLHDPEASQREALAAAALVAERHTLTARLRTLYAAVQARQPVLSGAQNA